MFATFTVYPQSYAALFFFRRVILRTQISDIWLKSCGMCVGVYGPCSERSLRATGGQQQFQL
jgi:hypothetical protein